MCVLVRLALSTIALVCSLRARRDCFQLPWIILIRTYRGDMYGIGGPQARSPACGGNLYKLLIVRKRFAFGPQREYFDDPLCIGWTRLGEVGKGATEFYDGGGGLAVLLNSSSTKGHKSMFTGRRHAGEKWHDTLGWPGEIKISSITIDEKGWGMFTVGPKSAAIFVNEKHAITQR